MSIQPLSPLLQALGSAKGDEQQITKIATVTSMNTDGSVRVRFDGETAASIKDYRRFTSVPGYVGDRVVMLRVGQTWVVAGHLSAASGQGSDGSIRVLYRDGTTQVGSSTDLPNDSVTRSVWVSGGYTVPTGARLAHVLFNGKAYATSNAQVHWQLHRRKEDGATYEILDQHDVHNQTAPQTEMGPTMQMWFNVAGYPISGNQLQVVVNGNNDVGGGSWVTCRAAHIQITYFM